MSSGIIGMQRVSRYSQACVTIWESFYVIRDHWNAAFVSISISICKDMGVILCHPYFLDAAFVSDLQAYVRIWDSLMSSGIIGMQRLS